MENKQMMESTPQSIADEPQLDFQQNEMEEPAEMEAIPAAQAPATAASLHVVDQMQHWTNLLENSEKGGFGNNSQYYNRVHDGLKAVNQIFRRSFSTDVEQNKAILKEARILLGHLLGACLEYTARKPKTKKGKARKRLVEKINAYVTQDLLSCQDATISFLNMTAQEQSQQTWDNVLAKNRIETIQVNDFNRLKAPGGGAASDVRMIEFEGSQTKFFKKEDSIDAGYMIEYGQNSWFDLAVPDTLEAFPNLNDTEKAYIQKGQNASFEGAKAISEQCLAAYKLLVARGKQIMTVYQAMIQAQRLDQRGGMINFTRRNVATSRMAELLGLGHLVAKSQTVELQDQTTQKTIRGNLMDGVQGKTQSQVKEQLMQKQITSGFMRDALNLQVLDALCGQGDRHMGNLFFITDQNGRVSGLKGIDNDASFGLNIDAISASEAYRKDARIFDQFTGNMVLPFMDDTLANRILELDTELVRFVLADLITPDEVDAACLRLENMKAGISAAKRRTPDRFLRNEADWTLHDSDRENAKSVETLLDEQYTTSMEVYEKVDEEIWWQIAKELHPAELYNEICAYTNNRGAYRDTHGENATKKVRDAVAAVDRYYRGLRRQKYFANRNYLGKYLHEAE